jgi:hypothetical protein
MNGSFFKSERCVCHFAIVVLVEVFVVMILGWTRQARQIERVPHRLHEHAVRSERQHNNHSLEAAVTSKSPQQRRSSTRIPRALSMLAMVA